MPQPYGRRPRPPGPGLLHDPGRRPLAGGLITICQALPGYIDPLTNPDITGFASAFQLTPDHSTSPGSSVTLMFSGMVTVSQAPASLTVQCIDDTGVHAQPVTLRATPTWWVAKITKG